MLSKNQNTITDISNSWTVTKKRDKVRRLDNLIITNVESNDRKYAKNVLMMLVLLNKVKYSDVESAIVQLFSKISKLLRVRLCFSNLFQPTSIQFPNHLLDINSTTISVLLNDLFYPFRRI